MRHQPIPVVTLKDVERIVRRDFPAVQFDSALAVLKAYEESASGRRERPRVQLATLKLANGDLSALQTHINAAIQDFRDVLAPAEYPEYSKLGFRTLELPIAEQQRIVDADWKQYQTWLLL